MKSEGPAKTVEQIINAAFTLDPIAPAGPPSFNAKSIYRCEIQYSSSMQGFSSMDFHPFSLSAWGCRRLTWLLLGQDGIQPEEVTSLSQRSWRWSDQAMLACRPLDCSSLVSFVSQALAELASASTKSLVLWSSLC